MKIIIADDHQLITEGLDRLIFKHFKSVEITTVQTISHLLQNLKEEDFDFLLLDIRMGNKDARDYIKEIKTQNDRLKIIMISSHDDFGTVQSTLSLGVDGYIVKDEPSQNIIQAINSINNGERYLSDTLKQKISEQTLLKSNNNNQIKLTRREKEVLQEILLEKSNKEIGETLFISEKTVENHRTNLFIKFEVKNVAGLVKKAILLGFVD